MITPRTIKQLECLHNFVLHCESSILSTKTRVHAEAKAVGLLNNFGHLKPQYAELLDDLATGVQDLNNKEK